MHQKSFGSVIKVFNEVRRILVYIINYVFIFLYQWFYSNEVSRHIAQTPNYLSAFLYQCFYKYIMFDVEIIYIGLFSYHGLFLYPGFQQYFLQALMLGLPYHGFFHILVIFKSCFFMPWFIYFSCHITSFTVYNMNMGRIKLIYCQLYKLYTYVIH